jgi:hypothetical protein
MFHSVDVSLSRVLVRESGSNATFTESYKTERFIFENASP